MTGKQAGKPLLLKACVMTRLTDKSHAKLGQIRGLRATGHQDLFSVAILAQSAIGCHNQKLEALRKLRV